ncbi:MAG TPA: FliM/FliN family flagellar motor switch protein [Pyrinomonadaceae bacterium]|nr:FliM/FliN family flagellar motor switch protein [Pyrinomonadaceae bacterium]
MNREELRTSNTATIDAWRNHLDLVLHVAVELGRTTLTAGEILDLETNSIVQLPRSTGEGVDVVADGRLLARGEIVMIEDRTGIRINELNEPQE